jgi:hypothetical protein
MNRSTGSIAAATFAMAVVPAAAQWLNIPAKGIPRTKDGKPDLTAPAPRKTGRQTFRGLAGRRAEPEIHL